MEIIEPVQITYLLPCLRRGKTVTIRWQDARIPVVVGYWRICDGGGIESSYNADELRRALALVARPVNIAAIVAEVFP